MLELSQKQRWFLWFILTLPVSVPVGIGVLAYLRVSGLENDFEAVIAVYIGMFAGLFTAIVVLSIALVIWYEEQRTRKKREKTLAENAERTRRRSSSG